MKDPYLYPGTEVLKNLQEIVDAALLESVEADCTGFRLRQLTENPIDGEFDFEHLCRIHEFIFQDIFEWAGVPRIINISKSEIALGGLSIDYSDVFDIRREAESVCNRIKGVDWISFDNNQTAKEFAKCLSLLWRIHPFREGNTRTTITFFCDFADSKGFPLNREMFRDNTEYVRRALVAASANLKDYGDYSKSEYIEKFILDSISRS